MLMREFSHEPLETFVLNLGYAYEPSTDNFREASKRKIGMYYVK